MRRIATRLATLCIAMTAAAFAAPAPAAAEGAGAKTPDGFSFAYTGLDLGQCETMTEAAPELPGWMGPLLGYWRCEGLTEDWPVHVLKGELWVTVTYGHEPFEEPAARPFLQSERVHDRLEWVMAKPRTGSARPQPEPVATILRFFTLMGEKADLREYPILVVTQLKPGAVCPIAYVDPRANPRANEDAREAAARLAGSYPCDAGPELVGPQSPGVFGE